jgi:hypothetical protein
MPDFGVAGTDWHEYRREFDNRGEFLCGIRYAGRSRVGLALLFWIGFGWGKKVPEPFSDAEKTTTFKKTRVARDADAEIEWLERHPGDVLDGVPGRWSSSWSAVLRCGKVAWPSELLAWFRGSEPRNWTAR